MKKKINLFLFLITILFTSNLVSNEIKNQIQPEPSSKIQTEIIKKKFKKHVVVSANDYATKIGIQILRDGGNAIDATVAIQLALGLVEPQSSGLGGGIFITFHNSSNNKIISFEGREKAPRAINENIFLDLNNKPKKFFDAAIGGASVGVPGVVKTLFEFHKLYGVLPWKNLFDPVIQLAKKGIKPPNRLKNAIKKEKFVFKINPNIIYNEINNHPQKNFKNLDYAFTLEEIAQNHESFYSGEIAEKIVHSVNNSINPGELSIDDLVNYKPEIQNSLCYQLKIGYKICGPNLPSSGTICIIQALILLEEIIARNHFTNNKSLNLEKILEILNFVYYFRDKNLADSKFVKIDIKKILDKKFLKKEFNLFKKKNITHEFQEINEILSSTSHFSVIDKNGNIVSATSSIESSFGSRLFVDGFFLNNQLTDFSFRTIDKLGNKIFNKPEGEKRPLSSMSPLIIYDENNNFYLTIGSPGGKAIISYILRVLIDVLYLEKDIDQSIKSPNYIAINGKIFLENEKLNLKLKKKGKVRKLTSGLAIIQKKNDYYLGVADNRRDGSVRGD
ncbi:MAG: hypothetical protein CMM99_04010 [Rickettsiales bacterium]|nr:hypothetical protein [Rickettsiales bacterium]